MQTMPMPAQFSAAKDPDQLLRENEAAALLGYSVRALQNWRVRGGGPHFVKVSARSVRYRRGDLIAWVRARIRQSTSDAGAGSPL